jgi:protein-tyrosine phosphatase
MIRVLFVCLANVCRSPMADAVFAHLVRAEELEQVIEADSAGTADWEMGSAPHPGTQYILEANGITYSGEARRILKSDLNDFDYIITMDDENLRAVRKMGKGRAVVAPLMSFVEGTTIREVPDPYFDNGFEIVYMLIEAGAKGLLGSIKKTHELEAT